MLLCKLNEIPMQESAYRMLKILFFLILFAKLILYGKIRYRLFMKIDLYDTFRILEEKGYFGNPINGALKNETPMQESAYRRSKIGSFLYFSIFTAIGVLVFVMRLLKTEGFLLILSNVHTSRLHTVKHGIDCL